MFTHELANAVSHHFRDELGSKAFGIVINLVSDLDPVIDCLLSAANSLENAARTIDIERPRYSKQQAVVLKLLSAHFDPNPLHALSSELEKSRQLANLNDIVRVIQQSLDNVGRDLKDLTQKAGRAKQAAHNNSWNGQFQDSVIAALPAAPVLLLGALTMQPEIDMLAVALSAESVSITEEAEQGAQLAEGGLGVNISRIYK